MRKSDIASRDPMVRKDGWRRLAQVAIAATPGMTLSHMARATGHSQQRYERMLRYGEQSCIQLSDLSVWVEETGPGLLEAAAGVASYGLIPLVKAEPVVGMTGGVRLVKEATDVLSRMDAALSDGRMLPNEAAEFLRELDEVDRASAALRAHAQAIADGVVTPISMHSKTT